MQYVCDCLTDSCDFMDSFTTPYEDGMGLLVVSVTSCLVVHC